MNKKNVIVLLRNETILWRRYFVPTKIIKETDELFAVSYIQLLDIV